MFTLKIRWVRNEGQEIVDETTLFIAADEVETHGIILNPEKEMSAWEEGSYFNYQVISEGPNGRIPQECKLIKVEKDSKPTRWYLCSNAWLMGPDGKTIERLI